MCTERKATGEYVLACFMFCVNEFISIYFTFQFGDKSRYRKPLFSGYQLRGAIVGSVRHGPARAFTDNRKIHLFYKIIHFSMQFSAKVNRFSV